MTATFPARPDVRLCRLYRFYVEHPLTGEVVLGYVGETIREPVERLIEHLQTQPWFDTVVRWERDPRVFASKVEVLAAERAAIVAERPLYNVEHNTANPLRVPPPAAIRQRRARDAQLGRPRWVHPADRPVRPRPGVVGHRQWEPWQRIVAFQSSALVMLTLGWWSWLDRRLDVGVWWHGLAGAAVVSVLLLGWGWWRQPDTVKLWRRRGRKMWRAFTSKPKRRRR